MASFRFSACTATAPSIGSGCAGFALLVSAALGGCASSPATAAGVQGVSELVAADGATGDQFGFSLAASADLALIGAPAHEVAANADQGQAYVFLQSSGAWRDLGAPLVAADGAIGDNFGFSMAMSGDTVVIGAPGHRVDDQPFQGAAYVFVSDGTNFVQQGSALVASDGRAADAFGSAVAISDDTILVGAPASDVDSQTGRGKAYVFVRRDRTWQQQGGALLAPDGKPGDTFGSSVALSGETAVVSAPVHQVGMNPYQGAAYVFVRENETWRQQGNDLIPEDGGPFDQLDACAVSGDSVLLGVPFHTIADQPKQGAAYLFVRSGDDWTQAGPPWVAPDGAADDHFGNALALDGESALVAAPMHRNAFAGYRGAGFAFSGSGASWVARAPLVVDGGAVDELLGSSLALAPRTVLLGAPSHRVEGRAQQGAAYAFTPSADGCASLECGDLRAAGGCSQVAVARVAPRVIAWNALLAAMAIAWRRRRSQRRFRCVSN